MQRYSAIWGVAAGTSIAVSLFSNWRTSSQAQFADEDGATQSGHSPHNGESGLANFGVAQVIAPICRTQRARQISFGRYRIH
jgi:hypothetical protein